MWVQRRVNSKVQYFAQKCGFREERIGRSSSLLRSVGSETRESEGAVVCKVGEVISAIKNAKGRFRKHSWKFSLTFLLQKNETAGDMHFHEAVKIKSSFPGAYLNLGNMYKALGIPQEAIARYQHALQTWPYYGVAYEEV